MMEEFSGKVVLGDECRVCFGRDGIHDGAVFIGGIDVVEELCRGAWPEPVTAMVNGKAVATGQLFCESGFGSDKYAPLEFDSLDVGDFDLLSILAKREGQLVTLTITDTVSPL